MFYLCHAALSTCTLYRSDHWWNFIVLTTFTAQDWIENFRMSKQPFEYLCQRLSPFLNKRDSVMRRAISVQQWVAITLWCLATPAEYCTIAHLFGVARSTVCEIVHETSLAIVRTLMTTYIKFPTGNQLERVIETSRPNGEFLNVWGQSMAVISP